MSQPSLNLDERRSCSSAWSIAACWPAASMVSIGLKSRKAIRLFQLEAGLPADGSATKGIARELRRRAAG